MLDFVEEAFDQISVAVKMRTEGRHVLAGRHRLDVCPCAALGEALAQRVPVIGTVGQKDLPLDQGVQHVAGALAVMGLTFGQLQGDRQPFGIDKGMDLCRQPAARATHAISPVLCRG